MQSSKANQYIRSLQEHIFTQDNLGGLEAKSVTGCWLHADPIPGAVLINVGDLLENLSCGRSVTTQQCPPVQHLQNNGNHRLHRFPATRHRVVVPEQEFRRRSPRQSIAFFVHPDDQVMIRMSRMWLFQFQVVLVVTLSF